MYDVGGKLVNGIKSMFVNSIACVKLKEGESECFKIDECEAKMHHVPLAFQCVYGGSDERGEDGDEINGGGERVEITWLLVCRLGFMW